MATTKTTREQAAETINATIDGEHVYYHDDSTNEDYRNPVADLDYLAELLDDSDDEIRVSAYSHWCAGTSGELVRHIRQRDINDLEWHQLPKDGGQIVDIKYASTEDWLYCRRHDRSDNAIVITCERIDDAADEDDLRFEPQNGLLPDTKGESYIVIAS